MNATGATGAVGVAGCLHGGDSDTGSSEDVVEAFLNADDSDEADGYLPQRVGARNRRR